MILITHPLDGRKQGRCGLIRRLAALSLALVWTVALSLAASALWADDPSSWSGGRDHPALEMDESAPGPAGIHSERKGT